MKNTILVLSILVSSSSAIACNYISLPMSAKVISGVTKTVVDEVKASERDSKHIKAVYNRNDLVVVDVENYRMGTCKPEAYDVKVDLDCSLIIKKAEYNKACL